MPDMLVRLYDLPAAEPIIERLSQDGILIRRAMAYEKHIVVTWVQQAFGRGWAGECDIAFSNSPISCYIATYHGEVVGFGCYDSTCKNYFGPTGVSEATRGKGIGTALLLACLHALRAQGYAYAIIGAAGPKEYYAKTVGAIEIPGSTPGIYRDLLKSEPH